MFRRTLLQRLSQLIGTLPFLRAISFAESTVFNSNERQILMEVATLVLPSALGEAGLQAIGAKFENYVSEYRSGADTDHGYGVTHVIPKPLSPASTYAKQLSSLPSPVTRAVVELALRQAGVKDLPRVPDGKSVISDLMSFYFRSSDANDLCYQAAIGRDLCRGLAGSDQPPAPLRRVV